MMDVLIVLKNSNFRYRGELIEETNDSITLQDIKIGKIIVAKDSIAVLQKGDFL